MPLPPAPSFAASDRSASPEDRGRRCVSADTSDGRSGKGQECGAGRDRQRGLPPLPPATGRAIRDGSGRAQPRFRLAFVGVNRGGGLGADPPPTPGGWCRPCLFGCRRGLTACGARPVRHRRSQDPRGPGGWLVHAAAGRWWRKQRRRGDDGRVGEEIVELHAPVRRDMVEAVGELGEEARPQHFGKGAEDYAERIEDDEAVAGCGPPGHAARWLRGAAQRRQARGAERSDAPEEASAPATASASCRTSVLERERVPAFAPRSMAPAWVSVESSAVPVPALVPVAGEGASEGDGAREHWHEAGACEAEVGIGADARGVRSRASADASLGDAGRSAERKDTVLTPPGGPTALPAKMAPLARPNAGLPLHRAGAVTKPHLLQDLGCAGRGVQVAGHASAMPR